MAFVYGTFKGSSISYTGSSGRSRTKTVYLAPYVEYDKLDGATSASYVISNYGIAMRANKDGTSYINFSDVNSQTKITTTSSGGMKSSTNVTIRFASSVSINLSTINNANTKEYHYSINNGPADSRVTKTHSVQTFTINVGSDIAFFGKSWAVNTSIFSDTVSAKTSYTITLNGNGGTSTSATQWYGEDLSLSGYSSSRTGYTFAGWYTAASGGSQVVTVQPNAATTYYAHWTENTATLTYNANGHGTAPQPVTMKYTTATTAAALPTEPYWACKGWNTASDGSGTMYQPDDVIKAANVVPSATVLYAIWEKTAPDIFTKIDGIWCRGPLRVKANDQWFECTEGFIKIGGEWKPLG